MVIINTKHNPTTSILQKLKGFVCAITRQFKQPQTPQYKHIPIDDDWEEDVVQQIKMLRVTIQQHRQQTNPEDVEYI